VGFFASLTADQPFESVLYADFANCRESVDKEDSIEVVGLMLDRACEKAVGFDDQGGAVELWKGGFEVSGAADFVLDALNAEAAFAFEFFFFSEFEGGVDENQRHDVFYFNVLTIDSEI